MKLFYSKKNLAGNSFYKLSLLIGVATSFLVGCGTTQEKPPTNDFPTQARVEYVIECMNQHGGQNYQNMYACVCSADSVASKMSFAEYSAALTFERQGSLRGERGAIFRDPPHAKNLRQQLKDAKSSAISNCNISP